MARAIFISYRRDDSEGEAGRLYDDLSRSFGDDSVFMDVAGIDPGTDFRTAIDKNVASCGVLLAVIGPRWVTLTGPTGARRLDDANDFVRLEIASALARNVAVIPVLVHEAKMPHPDDLPENLKELSYRNSVELSHTRWNSDVQLLTSALAQYVKSTAATDAKPIHATVSVQLPAPKAPGEVVAKPRSKAPWIVAAVVALAAVVFGAQHFLARPAPAPSGDTADAPATVPSLAASTSVPAEAAPVQAPAQAPAETPVQTNEGSSTLPSQDSSQGEPGSTQAGIVPFASPTSRPQNSAPAESGNYPAPASSPPAGLWINTTPMAGNSILAIQVSGGPGQSWSMRAWGNCQPVRCEWGAQPAFVMGQSLSASWLFGTQMVVVMATPRDGKLVVQVAHRFANGVKTRYDFEFVHAR